MNITFKLAIILSVLVLNKSINSARLSEEEQIRLAIQRSLEDVGGAEQDIKRALEESKAAEMRRIIDQIIKESIRARKAGVPADTKGLMERLKELDPSLNQPVRSF